MSVDFSALPMLRWLDLKKFYHDCASVVKFPTMGERLMVLSVHCQFLSISELASSA